MRKDQAVRVLGLLAACALVLAACSGGKQPLTDEQAYKRFVGTWENAEAQISQPYAKVVLQPDYAMKLWVRTDSPSFTRAVTVRVKKTWVDAEGGTCCQFFFIYGTKNQGFGLGLMRLDKAKRVLEMNWKLGKEEDVHPDQIERKAPGDNWTWYFIFYRK